MKWSIFSMIRMFLFLLILSFGMTVEGNADGKNINNVNINQFHYPVGKMMEKHRSDEFADFTMLAADSVEKIEKFYLDQGFKQESKDTGSSTIKLIRMLAPHVPATVTLVYANPVVMEGFFGDYLMMSVATGTHTMADLNQLKQKYAYLGRRFYSSDPRAMMEECEKPANTQIAKKKMTAEERGRKMQELVMQGKYDEANAMASSFTEANQSMQNEATKDRWTDEIKCLKQIDKKSYKVQIKIFIERDDVAG